MAKIVENIIKWELGPLTDGARRAGLFTSHCKSLWNTFGVLPPIFVSIEILNGFNF
jgi:hypothetical protein